MPWDRIYKEFKDHYGAKVYWYERDRYNTTGGHMLHPQYGESGFDDVVAECLRAPSIICADKDNTSRKCFYLDLTRLNHPYRKYLKVVIDYNLSSFAKPTVITPFYVDKINPRDQKLWP